MCPRLPFVLLLAVLAAGCAAAADPEAMTVRDSAGIRIVENARPALDSAAAWRLEAEPAVVIGAAEGDEAYLLHRVGGALRLRDGRIVVLNRGTQQLRFYDANGRHLQTVGGRGGGPGEYQFPTVMLRVPPDSLLVADANAARFTLLDGVGRVVSTQPADWRKMSPVGRFADGRLATLQFADSQQAVATGYQRVAYRLLAYTPAGEREENVATLCCEEQFRVEIDGGGIANFDVPFGRQQQVAVQGEHVYSGVGDTFELEVRRAGGTLERLVRASIPPRAVRPVDLDRWRSGHLERAANNARFRPAVERLLRDAPVPTTMPAYSALRIDARGNVWARGYAPAGEAATTWQVFDPNGHWLCEIELPPDLEVTDVGEDYVLGVVRDELDIESVRLYRLLTGS